MDHGRSAGRAKSSDRREVVPISRYGESGMQRRLAGLLNAAAEWRQRRDAAALTQHRPAVILDPDRAARLVASLVGSKDLLQKQGKTINVWKVAGLARDEIRNTKVLAWALDCRESHGFGGAIFESLLNTCNWGNNRRPSESLTEAPYEVYTEHCAFSDRANRLDIAMQFPNLFVVIEVKIDAVEGHEQLRRYGDVARKKARARGCSDALVIFLTPNPIDVPEGILNLTWRQVARSIRSALVNNPSGGPFAGSALSQFADHCSQF